MSCCSLVCFRFNVRLQSCYVIRLCQAAVNDHSLKMGKFVLDQVRFHWLIMFGSFKTVFVFAES